jgi:hypothetical protein
MTMRSFGKVMPIHIDMLQLAGYVPAWRERDIRPATTDEEYLRTMRAGRTALRRATGQDFGYDLAAWREFLSSAPDDKFGYRHPYAFRSVDRAVQQAIRSQQRKQLVGPLEESEAEPGADANGGGG